MIGHCLNHSFRVIIAKIAGFPRDMYRAAVPLVLTEFCPPTTIQLAGRLGQSRLRGNRIRGNVTIRDRVCFSEKVGLGESQVVYLGRSTVSIWSAPHSDMSQWDYGKRDLSFPNKSQNSPALVKFADFGLAGTSGEIVAGNLHLGSFVSHNADTH